MSHDERSTGWYYLYVNSLNFTAIMQIVSGNPYVLVSPQQAAKLQPGWRKPLPVLVQINGQPDAPWHINMMPIGDGSFYLYLHGDVRKASGTKVGDRVQVSIRFDEDYHNGPMHPMPDWFRAPLEANPAAKAAWDALPPSRQKEVLRYFSWIQSDEAQQRNLSKAMQALSGKETRFLARTWKNGK